MSERMQMIDKLVKASLLVSEALEIAKNINRHTPTADMCKLLQKEIEDGLSQVWELMDESL